MYKNIIKLGQRLLLITQKPLHQRQSTQVCNFKDNYYGDQQCRTVKKNI